MRIKEITLKFNELTREELNSSEYNILANEAINGLNNAYAPYSQFSVSAAILLENGEIIVGTNQENAAYPSGLCAERVAMFYANSKYPNVPVKALAVCAKFNNQLIKEAVPPCGACRQVLMETETRFKKPITIILVGAEKVLISENVKQLLPLNFDENFLK